MGNLGASFDSVVAFHIFGYHNCSLILLNSVFGHFLSLINLLNLSKILLKDQTLKLGRKKSRLTTQPKGVSHLPEQRSITLPTLAYL